MNTPVTQLDADGRPRRRRPRRRRAHRVLRRHLVAAAAPDRRHHRARRRRSAVQDAARGLRYRDFLTVALVIDGEDLFPDNWIYIHEPGVRVGRIQNFRSWSPWMVPDPTQGVRRPRVLLLPGRRPVGHGRRRPRRARDPRDRAARPRPAPTRSSAASSPASRSPTRCTTPTTRSASTTIRALARGLLEPPAGRPQRPAPVQQLRPLDADVDPRGREHPRRHRPRPVGGQRGVRLPRGGRGGRAPVQARAGDQGDARAARPSER